MVIVNSEVLTERFGQWPSFHDAEVYRVRLDSGQTTDGASRIEIDVHVLPHGETSAHTIVTFEFLDVDNVELDGFGGQNVLFDLEIAEDFAPPESISPRIAIELPSSNGLSGRFRCRSIAVSSVADFVPGEHSVYGG